MPTKLTMSLSATALAALLFTAVLILVPGDGALPVEYAVQSTLCSWRLPGLDVLFGLVTWLGSMYAIGPAVILLAMILTFRGQGSQACYLLTVVLGASFSTFLLKQLIDRARPAASFACTSTVPDDPSFPSGHAAQAFAVCLAVVVMLSRRQARARGTCQTTLLVTLIMLLGIAVAFSRLYLQVHWLLDILAGGAAALFWCAVSFPILKR